MLLNHIHAHINKLKMMVKTKARKHENIYNMNKEEKYTNYCHHNNGRDIVVACFQAPPLNTVFKYSFLLYLFVLYKTTGSVI